MDIRDDNHTQLVEIIKTLRVMSTQETPAPLIWEEMQRYLDQVAAHLERNMLPRIEEKKPHLDLRGGTAMPKVAEYVGATSQAAAVEDEQPEETPAHSFLPPQRNGARA